VRTGHLGEIRPTRAPGISAKSDRRAHRASRRNQTDASSELSAFDFADIATALRLLGCPTAGRLSGFSAVMLDFAEVAVADVVVVSDRTARSLVGPFAHRSRLRQTAPREQMIGEIANTCGTARVTDSGARSLVGRTNGPTKERRNALSRL
jgi:hypothetical protein